jgi:hypothetical protein
MAYEYRLSPIDITGALKYVQDNALKQEQMNLKYDESMNKAIDDQQKLYNGKVRKQDVAEFDEKFTVYANAQKSYQALNRRGGRGGDLTAAKVLADEARANMMGYVGESTGLGQMQIGVGKIFKDPTKLVNTQKYTEVYTDLSSMSTGELKQKYGELSKIPTDFEFKAEDFTSDDMKDLNGAIRDNLPISPQGSMKQLPAIDPITGKQKTSKVSLSFENLNKVVDVPMNRVVVGLDQFAVLNAVKTTSANQRNNDYMKLLQKETIKQSEDASNPQLQKEAQDKIKKTMDIFGIRDKANVNQYHLYASNFIDKNRLGEVEIEDWSKMGDIADVFSKANGLKLQGKRLEKLQKDLNKPIQDTSMKTLGQLLNIYKIARDTGLTNVDQWRDEIVKMFQANNLPMTRETIAKASVGIALQASDVDSLLFTPGVDAGGKKKKP